MQVDDWRLITTPLAQGAWNMALDEALLESVGEQGALPVLRLYSWQPPCLSLGYAQPFADVNRERLQSLGWSLVRRPTGGRAVLHIDELTYSVIAPLSDPRVKGSIIESYRRLSQALLRTLSNLGISAQADHEYEIPTGSQKNAAVCFEVPSNYEITADGKKLIGSAQARKHHGVLQHGALPLSGDITRIIQVLNFTEPAKMESASNRLLAHATTAESILGKAPDRDQAITAFVEGFSNVLNLNLLPSEPTSMELQRTQELIAEKYANQDWINHI